MIRKSCLDCKYKNRCLEWTRLYPCSRFKEKEPPIFSPGRQHRLKAQINIHSKYNTDKGENEDV